MIRRSLIIILAIIAFLIIGAVAAPIAISGIKVQGNVRHGNRYLQEGNYVEAISSFKAALKISSRRLDAKIGLAKAYMALGEFNETEKNLKDAISINNKEPKLYIELAKLYLEINNPQDAIAILNDGYERTKNKTIKKILDNLEPDVVTANFRIP